MDSPPLGPQALHDLHERDRERGVDPFAHPKLPHVAMPVPTTVTIPAPDWRREEELRRARAPVREPRPALHVEDEESAPARPRKRTPNIDTVRSWQAEQMRPSA